ncbi:hypothetical protein [Sutcliffiella rhizosphaerae]|uniref:Uncharacterized protein n=1 Tax=Sutcliffiella rhizosphaerae TaxID=2880967 RepID=A0ABN8AB85_9BACI|nr:hypothetical protein [Sutcliffiella rhizosphaerae]CAG9622470.1 hypothetical protein BACCIP111883_03261 [Sutcliffiella rhizosphaerae]
MFHVKTYISKDSKWYEDRLPLEKFKNQYVHLEKDHKKLPDLANTIIHARLYGFVQITYKGKEILGEEEYGSIAGIWGILLNLIYDCLQNGYSVEYFPDYVMKLTLKAVDTETVQFEIPGKNFILHKKEFFVAVLTGALKYNQIVHPIYKRAFPEGNSVQALAFLKSKLKEVEQM